MRMSCKKYLSILAVFCVLWTVQCDRFSVEDFDASSKENTYDERISEDGDVTGRIYENNKVWRKDQSTIKIDYTDNTEMQQMFIHLGNTLELCQLKLEESSTIFQNLMKHFIAHVTDNIEDLEENDELINYDHILEKLKLEDKLSFIPEEYQGYVPNRAEFWWLVHKLMETFSNACDDLPMMIVESDFKPSQSEPNETILDKMIRAMSKWIQKWFSEIRQVTSDLIDSCLLHSVCESNLKTFFSIINESLDKTQVPHNSAGKISDANENPLEISDFLFNSFGIENHILSDFDSRQGSRQFTAAFVRLKQAFEVLGALSSPSSPHRDYLEAVLGDLSGVDSLVDVLQGDDSSVNLRRVMVAAVSILRYPWESSGKQQGKASDRLLNHKICNIPAVKL